MSDLILWKDQELQKIKQDMDELLSCFIQDFSHPLYQDLCITPFHITTIDTKDTIVLEISIPDLAPQSLDVSLVNNTLHIRGEQTNEHTYLQQNLIRQRTFSSQVILPCPVKEEEITAVYRDEILAITLPKKDLNRPKKIMVNIAS
ncbi:MAG: Hsp20/alpha crystallin family protein [Desulfoplanes sp.]|nr:Hsp20/alpha crystallin family protein [Desulfoplanes sp.]